MGIEREEFIGNPNRIEFTDDELDYENGGWVDNGGWVEGFEMGRNELDHYISEDEDDQDGFGVSDDMQDNFGDVDDIDLADDFLDEDIYDEEEDDDDDNDPDFRLLLVPESETMQFSDYSDEDEYNTIEETESSSNEMTEDEVFENVDTSPKILPEESSNDSVDGSGDGQEAF